MPNTKTIRALKAAHRGKLVPAGPPDELVASLNKGDHRKFSRRGRRVVRLDEFTDEEIALIANSEQRSDDAYIDDLLEPNEQLRRTVRASAPRGKRK